MPVTVSYDLKVQDGNVRTYVRSMLERFGWKRLGGSVFRYEGRTTSNGLHEDWLNDVAPALMFLRSYILQHSATFNFFTLDASSVSMLDHSDPSQLLGVQPETGAALTLQVPTNNQSSVETIRGFVTAAQSAT